MAKGGNKKIRNLDDLKDITGIIFTVLVRDCKLCKRKFWAKNGVNVCEYCKPLIVYNLNKE